jgi:uncharacterized damage-inducible protein DinB
MKETLLQLAQYNLWANKRMIEALLQQDDATLDRELSSSFPSLRRTAYHMWSAEFIWLQRLQLVENPVWIDQVFQGTTAEAFAQWQQTSQQLIHFVEQQRDDQAFSHVLQYYNSKKEPFKHPVYGILQHVFNHGTYHRGQLVTMLRQAGVTKIPATDLIVFIRKGR